MEDDSVVVEFGAVAAPQSAPPGDPFTVPARERVQRDGFAPIGVAPRSGQQFELTERGSGNRARTRSCCSVITAAVAWVIGRRRASRSALALL
jgi:hypothetical protein